MARLTTTTTTGSVVTSTTSWPQLQLVTTAAFFLLVLLDKHGSEATTTTQVSGWKDNKTMYCWECNSFVDWRCADPFEQDIFDVTDCRQKYPNATKPVCRKIVQNIEGRVRIWRSCGYLGPQFQKRSCYRRSGTFNVQIEFCHCIGDRCNRATTGVTAPRATTVAAAAAAALLMVTMLVVVQ